MVYTLILKTFSLFIPHPYSLLMWILSDFFGHFATLSDEYFTNVSPNSGWRTPVWRRASVSMLNFIVAYVYF